MNLNLFFNRRFLDVVVLTAYLRSPYYPFFFFFFFFFLTVFCFQFTPIYLMSLRYRDAPGSALRCTYEGTLRDLLIYYKPRGPKKLYYQILSIPIDQLENKRQFKCIWVANQFKEERELALFPNKDGTVADLLNEAREQVDLQPNGTGKLRLLEIISSKVFNIVNNDVPLEHLATQSQRTFRIEVTYVMFQGGLKMLKTVF